MSLPVTMERRMGMKPEDRPMVLMMATQIYCARIQAGTAPDPVGTAGEACVLVTSVDRHLPPLARRAGEVKPVGDSTG